MLFSFASLKHVRIIIPTDIKCAFDPSCLSIFSKLCFHLLIPSSGISQLLRKDCNSLQGTASRQINTFFFQRKVKLASPYHTFHPYIQGCRLQSQSGGAESNLPTKRVWSLIPLQRFLVSNSYSMQQIDKHLFQREEVNFDTFAKVNN